jgi:glycosyltransferase involved in cell wall biosynthesis
MSVSVSRFDTLVDANLTNAPLPRICFVTGELVGLFANGGLGTATTGLAELLAAHGAPVSIIYTGHIEGDRSIWRERYAAAGIVLLFLDELPTEPVVGPLASVKWSKPWLVYQALRSRSFDVVHFNDTAGEGMYCTLARKMGIAFQNTALMLAIHSPTEWILESNRMPHNWLGFSCYVTAERVCIATADVVWGPSRYLLEWIAARRYVLPPATVNQQYVIPTEELFTPGLEKYARPPLAPVHQDGHPRELVFFGRLEERKGLRLFTAMLTRYGAELARRNISVVFMGKVQAMDGRPTDAYLAERAKHWPFVWRIESGLGRQEAVSYLRSTPCLAVMASPVDNSPCTVYEAIEWGVPFIAARTGGIPELLHADDHETHLFDYTVESLARTLLQAVDSGHAAARPAILPSENRARWLAAHRAWRSFLPISISDAYDPRRWAVVIDARSQPDAALAETIATARSFLGTPASPILIMASGGLDVSLSDGAVTVEDATCARPSSDVLASFVSAEIDTLLFLRPGFMLDVGARVVLERALHAPCEALVPTVRVGSSVMPMLTASAALTMLEGEYDSGALVVKVPETLARLEAAVHRLDNRRPYLGLIDELLVSGGEVWPLPEVLVTARHEADLLMPMQAESDRLRSFARAPAAEVYEMLAVSRHAYRAVFPASPVARATFVQQLAEAAAALSPRSARRRLLSLAERVAGLAGTPGRLALARLVRLVRGK